MIDADDDDDGCPDHVHPSSSRLCLRFQTMSMLSVIIAIFVSITLSTAVVIAVVCCRHPRPADRRRRRAWVQRRGRGYDATAEVVVCEMEEFDATSFDQCSLSTTVNDVHTVSVKMQLVTL